MENPINNRVIGILNSEGVELNEENTKRLNESLNEIEDVSNSIDISIEDVKKTIINSSVHLLVESVMRDDKLTTLKILESKKNLEYFFDFTDKLNDLVTYYGKYKEDYETYYPELKEVKSRMGLDDNKLVNVVREVLNENTRMG
jgi:hypothetical protein